MRSLLELFVFLGGREAREGLAGRRPLDLDANLGLGFGAGFAQHGESAERLVVEAGDEIDFVGVVFLPELAALYLRDTHRDTLNVNGRRMSVNCSGRIGRK
jgi:hypothetical protein